MVYNTHHTSYSSKNLSSSKEPFSYYHGLLLGDGLFEIQDILG